LLKQINQQIQTLDVTVKAGCHVDASITHSPRKPKTKPAYEVVNDREDRDDETDAQANKQVIETPQPGVDTGARWVKKGGKLAFGYKQHTPVDDNGLVMAVETTAANQHDSKSMIELIWTPPVLARDISCFGDTKNRLQSYIRPCCRPNISAGPDGIRQERPHLLFVLKALSIMQVYVLAVRPVSPSHG
jgi:IS5 family transposase